MLLSPRFYKIVKSVPYNFVRLIFLLKSYVLFFSLKKQVFSLYYIFDFSRTFFSYRKFFQFLHIFLQTELVSSLLFSKTCLQFFYFLFNKSLNFFDDKKRKESNLKVFFSKLGYLKSVEEDFFFDISKAKNSFIFRNKNFKLLQNINGFFFKFFFVKDSFRVFSFKQSLIFFMRIFLNRSLFSKSCF